MSDDSIFNSPELFERFRINDQLFLASSPKIELSGLYNNDKLRIVTEQGYFEIYVIRNHINDDGNIDRARVWVCEAYDDNIREHDDLFLVGASYGKAEEPGTFRQGCGLKFERVKTIDISYTTLADADDQTITKLAEQGIVEEYPDGLRMVFSTSGYILTPSVKEVIRITDFDFGIREQSLEWQSPDKV